MTATRLACIVPFCKHTRGPRKGETFSDGAEWICGKHWKAVPIIHKRRQSRMRRLVKKAEAKGDAWLIHRFSRNADILWDRSKELAIEIAVGITAR